MPITIDKLEELDIAEVGQRCRVISLSEYDEDKQWIDVGDELEIDGFAYNSDRSEKYIWFKNITKDRHKTDFLYKDTVIERLKD